MKPGLVARYTVLRRHHVMDVEITVLFCTSPAVHVSESELRGLYNGACIPLFFWPLHSNAHTRFSVMVFSLYRYIGLIALQT
jgi:hypothetical protein